MPPDAINPIADIIGDGQRHAEIIRRVARFALGQEVVHEIDVSDERRVLERCVDGIRLAAADQGAGAGPAKVIDLLATGIDRASAQGGDAAAKTVEDMDRQLFA